MSEKLTDEIEITDGLHGERRTLTARIHKENSADGDGKTEKWIIFEIAHLTRGEVKRADFWLAKADAKKLNALINKL